ncbi:MAG: dihydropteroate synthase [Dehalococcoidia bacterium]|jgi:5-methyltetrahydrofolate corrinoid/iron sulfur protein methyltransferase
MFIPIGECIHIINKEVRAAIETRDKAFIQNLARKQVDCGAKMLDLNIGPQKKAGPEVMDWIVNAVQEVVDVPLSLDTTNAEAIEAGLKVCKRKPIINSTNADPKRMSILFPLAANYDVGIIALTLRATGLPLSADARAQILVEDLMPAAEAAGLPMQNIYVDPLVMTVNGTQEHAPEVLQTTLVVKSIMDPPLHMTCGLSNVSNGAPGDVRRVLNRVYLVMLMGAGMDTAILDPCDRELMEIIRILENRDDSTPIGKAYLALYDACAAGGEFDTSLVDMSDAKQAELAKTIAILKNKTIYAHNYLQL